MVIPFSLNVANIIGPSLKRISTSLWPLPMGGNPLALLVHVLPLSDEKLTGICPSMELPLANAIRVPSFNSTTPACIPGMVDPVSFHVLPPSTLRWNEVPSSPPGPASQHWMIVPSEQMTGPAIT